MKRNPNFPFAPAKFPFFYGWVSMAAGTIGVLCSIPGQTIGVSVFTDYLIDELQLSRDALSTAYLIGTVASSSILTYAGKLYDKFGARFTAIFSAIALALTLVLFSFSTGIAGRFSSLSGIKYSIVSFTIVSILFFVLRFSGQGVLTLASRNLIMKWFDKKRGFANSISSAIQSFGFAVAPLFIAMLIAEFNWQNAYLILALLTILFVGFAYIFYRDNPEECGLIPDGKITEESANKNNAFTPSKDYTLKEARNTWVFWIFALSICFSAFFITGFTFNVISIFESVGYSQQKALGVFLPTSVVSILSAFIGNIVSDYTRLQKILGVYLLACLLSALGLAILHIPIGYYVLILGNGVMGGLFAVLASLTWPRFFGKKHLGAISGLSMSLIVFASAVAPLFFSLIFTTTGAYTYAGYISALMVVVLLVFFGKAKNPQLN
ncbi:MFS transporter [Marinifilum caeruleilacunae]|uniref:MFS transporter n=1 Tax=Marinifilum caeruleilacunae TaxID=2499076 RepID=A0ABX1WRJ6_9BACT|nr:MFS transporter [Marinifilum caeruleilacunae]NOU58553.1 MFS transporter [Marinifilum caeruleilacunae]